MFDRREGISRPAMGSSTSSEQIEEMIDIGSLCGIIRAL